MSDLGFLHLKWLSLIKKKEEILKKFLVILQGGKILYKYKVVATCTTFARLTHFSRKFSEASFIFVQKGLGECVDFGE